MDLQQILELINTVGFPIVCCLMMGYYIKYSDEKHTEEINELRKTVDNNTMALTRVLDKLDVD